MAAQYGDMLCHDVDLVGTSSELENDDDDEEEEEDEDEDAEDDDFYDEEDSNMDDEDFEGLSMNEEAEIMRYALASSHDLQQYENHLRTAAAAEGPQGVRDSETGCGETNNTNNNYDFGTCHNHNGSSCSDSNANLSIYNSTEKLIMETSLFDNKMRLIGNGIVLLVTTFALLVLQPLYFQQMTTKGPQFNVFGATLLVSLATALVFLLITLALGVAIKWKVPFYRPPLPWTKLIAISLSYGLSCILFATSCYQRVPCHLQDPLKGAALVFSLIFYFFFCRKVMGLQRIFSATTTVVGLFIAVDYGLCDEFRCRGTDLTDQFFQNTLNPASATAPVQWKSRALWSILYIIGIALWSLHVALLESSLVIPTKEKPRFSLKPTGFLRTVSRLVATSEAPQQTKEPVPDAECEKQEEVRRAENKRDAAVNGGGVCKSHPLHIIVWVHLLSVVVVAAFGWIDIFPVTGPLKPLGRHLMDTQNTLVCHLNVANDFTTTRTSQQQQQQERVPLEILTNFVPGSAHFNETVQRLRSRRSLSNETQLLRANATHHSLELHFNYTTKHHVNKTPGKHLNHNKFSGGASALHHPRSERPPPTPTHQADNAYTWKWFQGGGGGGVTDNKVNQTLGAGLNSPLNRGGSASTAADQTSAASKSGESGNCGRTQIYAVILLLVYILFAACLINFLIISESAVFTVCVVTGALPLMGIFWSLFEVSFDDSDQTVGLIWAPEVSGELISSLLGCPIVFLGIGLLCRAYFNEQFLLFRDELTTVDKSQCDSTLQLSYDNRNYYASSYVETGLCNELDGPEARSQSCHIASEKCCRNAP